MAKSAKKTAPKPAAKKVAVKTTVAPKKAAKKAAFPKAAAKKAAPKKAAKRQPNAAFMAPLSLSEKLAAVVGGKPLPRTEIVKKIWQYIKKNNLQDKTNKRLINADAKLKAVFGKDQVSMFDLGKIITKHVK